VSRHVPNYPRLGPRAAADSAEGIRTLTDVPRTSVIVCAYSLARWDELVAALHSVSHQSQPALETILVVDRSDELLRRARAELQRITIIDNAHQGGLSGARQTGAECARGELIAFLDDDAVADPDWLAELERAFDDPSVLGAGGMIVPSWVDPPPRWFPAAFNWVVGCSYEGLPTRPAPVRNVIGASIAMRAEVMRLTGGWEPQLGRVYSDDELGSTAEETEFCIRASRLHPGRYWLYVPSAVVSHRVPPERGTISYFIRRCRVEGRAKAVIAELEGAQTALRSERAYAAAVLPRSFLRELRGVLRGRPDGLLRAGAIALGLAVTAFEYGRTRVLRGLLRRGKRH
jgi:GT2 family glycosyltransferase